MAMAKNLIVQSKSSNIINGDIKNLNHLNYQIIYIYIYKLKRVVLKWYFSIKKNILNMTINVTM